MSSVTDRQTPTSSEALKKSLDRYIHAATVCNSLALLVSQGSSKEFAVRIALLSVLQKCWLNGHLILKLECSCDGTIDCMSDVVLHELNSSVSSDAEIHLTDSMRNLSNIQSDEQRDSIDNFEASSDFSIELTSECMNTTESTEEKSIISTDETTNLQKKPKQKSDNTTATYDTSVQASSPVFTARGPYTVCDICCRRFGSSHALSRHIKRVHKIEPVDVDGSNTHLSNFIPPCNDMGSRNGSKGKPQKAEFICTVCGRQFRLRQLLASHSVTHTGARPAVCRFPGCDKRFGQTSTRNYHERTHSDVRPYVCSQCGQSFKQPAIFKTHVATVHGDGVRPHRCSQCQKSFKLPGALQTHYKSVHMNRRPHLCTDCPKRFKYRSQLDRHKRALHAHEQPWHCSICNKGFTQPGNLRIHMRTHTGEKPYFCSVCGQNFAHSGTLKGHMATHKDVNSHTVAVSQTSSSLMASVATNLLLHQVLPLR